MEYNVQGHCAGESELTIMSTDQLPHCTATVSLNRLRRAERLESTIPTLCSELERTQGERDRLRAAAVRALADLRAGRNDSALLVLEGTLDA